jgi:1-acyl-sn-glycerol-3-phosphate acyltransferase
VPVALNSGLFWRRGRFLKHPGVITVEILPRMPLDLEGRNFLTELERRIEGVTARLVAEAQPAAAANTLANRREAAQSSDKPRRSLFLWLRRNEMR